MKVEILRRTAIGGVVVLPGTIVEVDKDYAKKLDHYGIAKPLPRQRIRKKADTQERFHADAEVK